MIREIKGRKLRTHNTMKKMTTDDFNEDDDEQIGKRVQDVSKIVGSEGKEQKGFRHIHF